uniref:Uncharacterized protein n=1 Tax=Arundo donax TaxID=35708 RepID=A0A0A9AZ94_ARUDO
MCMVQQNSRCKEHKRKLDPRGTDHSHREHGTMPCSSSRERRPRSKNIELLPCQNLSKVAFHVPKIPFLNPSTRELL